MASSVIPSKGLFPNFNDLIHQVGTGATYTAPSDCFCSWEGYGASASYCTISVNDVNVGGTYNLANTWSSRAGSFYLKKGDVIKITRAGGDTNATITASLYALY